MKVGDRVTCYRNNRCKTGAPDYLVNQSGVIIAISENGWFDITFDYIGVPFYLPRPYLKYEVKEQKNG